MTGGDARSRHRKLNQSSAGQKNALLCITCQNKKRKKKKKKNKKNKINIRDQFLQIEDAMYWARVLAWPKDEMVDRGVSDKHCCLLGQIS